MAIEVILLMDAYFKRVAPYLRNYLEDRPHELRHKPGGIEIYAMNFRNDHPRFPDCLVLNFRGYAGGQQREVLTVARVAQEFFEQMRLRSLWKLTGDGGLDALIFIQRLYETAAVFDFSKMIAELIHEKVPQHSVLGTPARRRLAALGRQLVWIDYQGNHQGRRILAPLSPRISSTIQISFPISVDELQSASVLRVVDMKIQDRELRNASQLLNTALAEPNELEFAFAQIEGMAQQAL